MEKRIDLITVYSKVTNMKNVINNKTSVLINEHKNTLLR